MKLPHRVQLLIDDRRMEQVVVEPTVVAAMYRKAREADEDARSTAIRVNSRITLAYQALHQYATAALEAAGLRAKHSGSHHRDLYYAVAGLGIPGLDDLDVRVTDAQRARTKSFTGLTPDRMSSSRSFSHC